MLTGKNCTADGCLIVAAKGVHRLPDMRNFLDFRRLVTQELEATGDLTSFGGNIRVPSYRGSTFLDPKVITSLDNCNGHHQFPAPTSAMHEKQFVLDKLDFSPARQIGPQLRSIQILISERSKEARASPSLHIKVC